MIFYKEKIDKLHQIYFTENVNEKKEVKMKESNTNLNCVCDITVADP
jgi:hypothetical protein